MGWFLESTLTRIFPLGSKNCFYSFLIFYICAKKCDTYAWAVSSSGIVSYRVKMQNILGHFCVYFRSLLKIHDWCGNGAIYVWCGCGFLKEDRYFLFGAAIFHGF